MSDNQLGRTVWLTLLVGLFIFALGFIRDEARFMGFSLCKMDIFSDVRPSGLKAFRADTGASPLPAPDSLPMPDSLALSAEGYDGLLPPAPPADPAIYGKWIEDYTPQQWGLEYFFRAVDSIRAGGKARVAYFGDSSIEGDLMLGDMRDSLQKVWGGKGVGFVPMVSEVAHYRRTFDQFFSNSKTTWRTYSVLKKEADRPALGISGYAYRPVPGAYVRYERRPVFPQSRPWDHFVLYYASPLDNRLVWAADNSEPVAVSLSSSDSGLARYAAGRPNMERLELRFESSESLLVYGVSLESGPGLYIDNFGMRSNSGGAFTLIRPEMAQRFDAWLDYDLVVLQVGLNAVTNSLKNINWYRRELEKTYAHLRACFPKKPILIVSVADRGGNINGECGTMISVPHIVQMQRELAMEHGFLFFDLFSGMGGEGTMCDFAQRKPPLAAADKTHLSHEGGRLVGHMMAGLFLGEWNKRNFVNSQ